MLNIYTDQEVVYDQRIFTTAHYKDMGPWLKAAINFINRKQKIDYMISR